MLSFSPFNVNELGAEMTDHGIEKRDVARWLYALGNRLPGVPDPAHLEQLRARTSDSTWSLYLDAIRERLARGSSYGSAIADALGPYLTEPIRQSLDESPATSGALDVLLRDMSLDLLANPSDYDMFRRIFNRAKFRYSQHHDDRRGPGPYDIDLYTAMTDSHPIGRLTGETVNVSFSFDAAGRLEGLRSYSMGEAPANPLRRGDEAPDYSGIRKRRGPRVAAPLWWLELTTPARDRYMSVTDSLTEFMQGWAAQTSEVELDTEQKFEVYGRARPFRGVQLVKIGDGRHASLPISRLNVEDYSAMQRLFSDRYVKWCLHSLVAHTRQDVFPYNCSNMFGFPSTPEELAKAKATYQRERLKALAI
jgi:hypothetical protein